MPPAAGWSRLPRCNELRAAPDHGAALSAPRRRKVTLSHIAEACGVSRATVSLVLRGSPLVHRDTRARVEQEMARQGYIYNRAAANLRR